MPAMHSHGRSELTQILRFLATMRWGCSHPATWRTWMKTWSISR